MKSLLICFGIVIICGCEHESLPKPVNFTYGFQAPKELPPVTTEGLGTLGFKLDGEVWVPFSEGGEWPELLGQLNKIPHYRLGIVAEHYWHTIEPGKSSFLCTFNLAFSPANRLGKFKLGFDYKNMMAIKFWPFTQNESTYVTTDLISGEVNIIRFDSINKVVAGVFYGKMINNSTLDTIVITEGRFDLVYE